MEAEFLGKGWRLPVTPKVLDGKGAPPVGPIASSSGEQKIRESIWAILSTAPGERVMRPDFGCGIHRLVFHAFSDAMVGQVAGEVTRALTLWEPRIELEGVEVSGDEQAPEILVISIDYRLRSTNSRFNLVYPFYLS